MMSLTGSRLFVAGRLMVPRRLPGSAQRGSVSPGARKDFAGFDAIGNRLAALAPGVLDVAIAERGDGEDDPEKEQHQQVLGRLRHIAAGPVQHGQHRDVRKVDRIAVPPQPLDGAGLQ